MSYLYYMYHCGNIEGFCAKWRILLFGLIFIFCKTELIFGRQPSFDMKKIIL